MLRWFVLVTFLVVSCAACSKEEATPAPSPSASPTKTTTTAPTAPTSSVPPELAGYNEGERAAYEAAVAAYNAFTKRNDAFYAVGETSVEDRKSTRLNSSHANISYAVFCLKKKN